MFALVLILVLGLLLPGPAYAANITLYETGFEAPAFTPGLPIRGQDGWEMFHEGEAISVSASNALTGVQCLRMDGALLEQTGPNIAEAHCFSRFFLDIPPSNPPPRIEITAYVRLDGPQTGTSGAPADDLMSANFVAVADDGGQGVRLGGFLVSSAGRILTIGSQPADAYRYSAPMTFGAYQKLVLRVDFIARTLSYVANDVELGSVPFPSSITTDRLASGYLWMAGPAEPLATPYHYDPADYTASFDDYTIASIPLPPVEGPEIVVEQPAGINLTNDSATVDFGSGLVGAGAGAQRTFTIRNVGSEILTGVTVTLDGPQASEFTFVSSPASTVDPGSNTTFTVSFSPTSAGSRTASLHIASNDSDEHPFNITLTGAAVLSPIEITQQAYLKSSTSPGTFGIAVAVSDDTAIVGATSENGAYILVRTGTNWTQQAYLKPSNPGAGFFGGTVAVDGDTVVVGASSEASNATGVNGNQNDNSAPGSGAAYVFVRSGTNWIQQAYLKASNTGAGDSFGYCVALSGDTIVVGAYDEDSNATGVNGNQGNNSASTSGATYVFVRSGTNWSQQAYLKASNTGSEDYFGYRVAVSGDTVVVGAFGEDSNATGVNGSQTSNSAADAGAAYVFVRSGTNWSQQAYLKASNTGADDWFGYGVAVSGDTVVVGALQESSNATGVNGNQGNNSAGYSGAAFVFVRTGTSWAQQAYLKASNTGANDQFGATVAVDGNTVVVAAPYEASNATGVDGDQNNDSGVSGAAYVFVRNENNWSQKAYLKGSTTEPIFFGGYPDYNGLAVDGDTIVAGAPNEGAAYVFTAVSVPTIVTQPAAQQIFTGSIATFTVSATTTNPPLSYQWRFNGMDLPGATSESLTIPDAQLANLGIYQVVVSDSIGSTLSAVVRLDLIDALFITTQPADMAVRAGSNATFTVAVHGAAPLHAQWQFNGADVADATNLVLTLPNVQVEQLGDYTVVISNQYGTVTSAVASLTFLTPPTIVAPPQPITVTAGENATFTVTVTNTATLPITYSWRKESTVLTDIVINSHTCSFTLENVQTNVTATSGPGNYRVVVHNAANPTRGLASPLVALTVVPATPHPTFSGYAQLGSGAFQLQFSGAAGTSYTILASANLIDWTLLGAATETASGQFEFTDAPDPVSAHRFYRVKQD